MTPQKIKANAPEGATHYNHRTETYYKQDADSLYYWCDGWRPSWYLSAQFMIYIKPL